ncbi:MAG: carboxypeptidase regulatory-like domain-containing protein, partial [Acidobacteria bacterium]|nr:carboxypeptidase regulatory-like domain-containing protein [Acidobacteriota bacterium]
MSARTTTGLAAAILLGASLCRGIEPAKLSGSIAGVVTDVAGIPQVGATVSLYNRVDRLVQQTLTGGNGVFAFASLLPDAYTLRVSLATFLPALRRNI